MDKMKKVKKKKEKWQKIWPSPTGTQIRDQMSGPDLHVFTLKCLALKKPIFSPIKNTFQIFCHFYLPLFYATFQCGS
jgi:hypothetical protein